MAQKLGFFLTQPETDKKSEVSGEMSGNEGTKRKCDGGNGFGSSTSRPAFGRNR